MAIGPIDYSGGNGFLQGLRAYSGMQEVQQQRMQAEQAAAQQEALKEFQSDWKTAYGDPAKMDALVAKYPGQLDTIKNAIGFQDDNHRMALGNAARDLRVAMASNNPQAIQQAATQHAQTLSSIGSSPQDVMEQLRTNPQGLAQTIDAVGMSALGTKDFYGVQNDRANQQVTMCGQDLTAETARRGQDISAANARLAASTGMTGNNIAAARLQLDQNKFAFDIQQAQEKAEQLKNGAPKITDATSKMIDSSINDATASRNSADSMSALAQQFRQEKPTTGLFGNASNMFAKVTGTDTALRDLRIRQNALVNNQVLRFLPPGPATDRDVEIVRQGAPTDMDNPEVVARWLDAMSNLERKSAQFNEFKAEWVSANGNPGQSRNGGNILGMDVQKGESLGQAAKRYMSQQQTTQTATQQASPQQSTGAVNWSDLP